MKKALIAIVVVAILAVGGYFFYQQSGSDLQGNISAKERIKQGTDPISVTREDVDNSDKADGAEVEAAKDSDENRLKSAINKKADK